MCTVLLPPGVNPIADNKYININNTDQAIVPILYSILFSVCLFNVHDISEGDYCLQVKDELPKRLSYQKHLTYLIDTRCSTW
jgi:hypothetical protein